MSVFLATLNQAAILFTFILMGYFLSWKKYVPENAQTVLSKLENCLFIPALVLGTFIGNFTVEKLTVTGRLFLSSFALALIAIGVSLVCVRFCSKDPYERNMFTYGLCFSNFGFMGNAVVSALFPDIFMEYLIFTLPLWTLIYLWGVPVLLIGTEGDQPGFAQRLKSFWNPMFMCTILGMIIGIVGIPIPQFLSSAISTAGSCMSPVAMLLTGMTIAQFNLKEILKPKQVYVVTFLRLIVYPLVFMGVMLVVPFSNLFATCAVCSLAMPLGLSTIIIPNALGKDTKVASGMALVSHVISCVTIPVVFTIFEMLIK